MIEQPNGDDEEEQDDEGDDKGYEGVDTPSREVADIGIS